MSEIEKAIKYYQEFYEDFKEDFSNNERIRLEMVLQALGEKQERDKGCAECLKFAHSTYQNNASHFKKYNYCPNCGRKLSENDGD